MSHSCLQSRAAAAGNIEYPTNNNDHNILVLSRLVDEVAGGAGRWRCDVSG